MKRYIIITLLLLMAVPAALTRHRPLGWHRRERTGVPDTLAMPTNGTLRSSAIRGKHSAAGDREKQYGLAYVSRLPGWRKVLTRAVRGRRCLRRQNRGDAMRPAEVRPLDISITKNVLGLFINSAVLLVIIWAACAGTKHPLEDGAPKGASAWLNHGAFYLQRRD